MRLKGRGLLSFWSNIPKMVKAAGTSNMPHSDVGTSSRLYIYIYIMVRKELVKPYIYVPEQKIRGPDIDSKS